MTRANARRAAGARADVRRHAAGCGGMARAARCSSLKGYRMLARRFARPGGEIDLIVRARRTVVFVEVKARGALDDAPMAITPQKRRLIERRTRQWLARNPWAMRPRPARRRHASSRRGAGRVMSARVRRSSLVTPRPHAEARAERRWPQPI